MEKRLADWILQGGISSIMTIEIVCGNVEKTTLDSLTELVDMVRSYLRLSTAMVIPER